MKADPFSVTFPWPELKVLLTYEILSYIGALLP